MRLWLILNGLDTSVVPGLYPGLKNKEITSFAPLRVDFCDGRVDSVMEVPGAMSGEQIFPLPQV